MSDQSGSGSSASHADLGIDGILDAEEIGRGGFGVVYKARQPSLHRTVAVKLVSSGVLDERARDRFERELHAMGTLSGHPNIVTVFDSGFTSDGRPFIVMDFMSGGSVADRLARGPILWQEAVQIGIKIAAALEAAHRAGVLHRDIKPENVLISTYGEAKLGDFGIARVQGGPETRTGLVTASMSHASPEILSGARPSVASDLYALGSTMHTILAGAPPFYRDTDESLVPMITRIAVENSPDLRPLGVPDSVCRVIERALSKEPLQRQTSAAEFGRDLQQTQIAAGLSPTELLIEIGGEPVAPPSSSTSVFTPLSSQTPLSQLPPPPTGGYQPPPPTGGYQPNPTGGYQPPQPTGGYQPNPTGGYQPGSASTSGPNPTVGPNQGWGAPQPPTPGSPPGKGKGKLVAVIVAVVVVLGGVGAALALGGGDEGATDGPSTTERTRTPRTDPEPEDTTTTEPDETTTTAEDTTTTAEPTTTLGPVGGKEISVFDLFVGLCFDVAGGDASSVSTVTERSCDEPHDSEVYELYIFPDGRGAPYPGDDSVTTTSEFECKSSFAPYVGVEYEASQLVVNWLTPNQGTWDDPDLLDREVVCYVTDLNGRKLHVPVQGSGI